MAKSPQISVDKFARTVLASFVAILNKAKAASENPTEYAIPNSKSDDPAEVEAAIAFRNDVLAEVAGRLGEAWNRDKVAQKLSALKGKAVFPPIPEGVKGRRVDSEALQAANDAAIAEMAELGMYPVYGDDGKLSGWTTEQPVA